MNSKRILHALAYSSAPRGPQRALRMIDKQITYTPARTDIAHTSCRTRYKILSAYIDTPVPSDLVHASPEIHRS